MLTLEVDGIKYVAQGVRDADIKDPEELIRRVKQISSTPIVLIDADFIAGIRHLQLLLKQAYEASRRGLTYAKQPEIDLLARVACENQLKEAVEKVGLKPRRMSILALLLGEGPFPAEVLKMLEELGTLDDSVIELTEEKSAKLLSQHALAQAQTSTLTDEDPLPYLLAEKAALLASEAKP
jgi:tRNA threonylcarbamoyladenosine modification (KEOPS) complex Cgi121 subunit